MNTESAPSTHGGHTIESVKWTGEEPRAVLLTALDLEYSAVRGLLEEPSRESHPAGTHYEIGHVRGRGGPWQVAIAEIGEGNLGSATATERAISYFEPQVVFFVGIAGSLKDDVRLGDVVVATRVYGIHGGRAEDQLLVRPVGFTSSYRLEQTARHIRRLAWHDQIGECDDRHCDRTTVHMKPIAAGEVLLDSSSSPVRDLLHRSYNDAAAIEMEGVGFLEAAHANNDVPAIVIRGISDIAAQKRESDREDWRGLAARHAAAFSVAMLADLDPRSFPIQRRSAGRTSDAESPSPRPTLPRWSERFTSTSLRELSQSTTRVMREVEEGASVFVTRHGRIIALITPVDLAALLLESLPIATDIANAEGEMWLGVAKSVPSDIRPQREERAK
jgi:nucleoside phosphorylase/antitoxin (DNA-binding transcriptional repressor) of toxin-antitoxin stability system